MDNKINKYNFHTIISIFIYVNFCRPLRDDEKLPVRTHHVVLESYKLDEIGTDPLEMERSKKKTKKEKDKIKKKKKVTINF